MSEARRLILVVKDRARGMEQAGRCQELARRFAESAPFSPANR